MFIILFYFIARRAFLTVSGKFLQVKGKMLSLTSLNSSEGGVIKISEICYQGTSVAFFSFSPYATCMKERVYIFNDVFVGPLHFFYLSLYEFSYLVDKETNYLKKGINLFLVRKKFNFPTPM